MISIAKRKAEDKHWVMEDNTAIQMPSKRCDRMNIPYIMATIALKVTLDCNIPDDFKKYKLQEELKLHTRKITNDVVKMEKTIKIRTKKHRFSLTKTLNI